VCNRPLDMTCAADSTWFVLVRSVAHHVHPFVMCKLHVVMFLLMINTRNLCDVDCAPQSQVCNRSLDMTCAADSTWFVLVRSVAHRVHPFVMCKLHVVMFLLMRNTINLCDVECAPQSQVCNRSLDMTCAADSTWFVLVRSVAHRVHPFVMCKLHVVMFLLMRNTINLCDVECAPQSQGCNRSVDMTCAAD
jgi:hypothetical protein